MKISVETLKNNILIGTPFLDVRAPVEFSEGHLPGAVNIPLLENEERHEVGIVYKKSGKEAAIALGHQLVSGENKEARIEKWLMFLKQNPAAILYCFRGGLRSQTVQSWLKNRGVEVQLLDGGYKSARQFFLKHLEEVAEQTNFLVVSGPTGSGKTHIIRDCQKFYPAVDLEFLASHRGSAFGFEPFPQPPQAQFENNLAAEFIRVRHRYAEKAVLLEDESRMIGRCVVPEKLFERMRLSPIIWVDESLDQRVENIFEDYVLNTAIGSGAAEEALALFDRYENSLLAISRKLGGARTQEIKSDLFSARVAYIGKKDLTPNRVWIRKLLTDYYDPLYLRSLERRQPTVAFKGPRKDVGSFLGSLGESKGPRLSPSIF